MTTARFALLILSLVAIATIFILASRKPVNGIALLLISLPILGLSRKAFDDNSLPFPSLETVAVIVLWLGVTFGRKEYKYTTIFMQRRIILLIIFFCASILSTVNSVNLDISVRIMLAGILSPCICYYLAAKYTRTFNDRCLIVLAIIIMGFIAFLYSAINMNNLQGFVGGALDIDTYKWFYNEAPVVNFFVVPSTAVAATVPIFPLGLWYWKHGLRYRVPISVAAFLSGIFICTLSLSRGSWLTMVFVIVCSFFTLYGVRRASLYAFATIGVASLIYQYVDPFIVPLLQSRLPGSFTILDMNIETRADNYLLAIRSGYLHPLFGVGLGSYTAIYNELNNTAFTPLWFAHSLFLTLIPEIGVLGTVAVVLFFGTHIVSAFKWRNLPKPDVDLGRAVGIAIVAIILVASTSGCHLISYLLPRTESTYFIGPVMIVAFSLMGIIAGRNNYFEITPHIFSQRADSHDE